MPPPRHAAGRGPLAPRTGALAAALAAASLLAGCGFHLEGHTPLPPLVKRPYLEAPDRQSDFVRSLRHALLVNGAQLAQERGAGSVVVSIVKDSFVRRVLSVSALNQPNEYEVTYTVGFTVISRDRELLPAQEVSATRSYSFDERLQLAKRHEEDVLRQDMARDLAERVMRRLSSL